MENRIIGRAIKAAIKMAGAITLAISPVARSPLALKLNSVRNDDWNGFRGFGRHISKRYVAQDKRDARKARNRKRHRAHA